MSDFGESPTVSSVYVHAPFCARRCLYCDFAVHVSRVADTGAWIDAIAAEWMGWLESDRFTLAPHLATLYVGGGTPSLLDGDSMARLRGVLGAERLTSPELEWTVEANPESLTHDKAEAWSAVGVNRVSLGVQSFDDRVLRWMGRLHGPERPAIVVDALRGAGIHNISVDLIFGLPESVERSWDDDLARALELDVPHLSLYGLTVEPGTLLGRRVAEGGEPAPSEQRYTREFLRAAEVLQAAGYHHYEVSNFARPGFEANHNPVYWRHEPYLGLGNGAHSYAGGRRWWNHRDWAQYRDAVMTSGAGVAGEEELTAGQLRLERIWLELRTSGGLQLAQLEGVNTLPTARWVREGLADVDGGRVRLTPTGWLTLDELAVELSELLGAP